MRFVLSIGFATEPPTPRPERKHKSVLGQYQATVPARGHLRDLPFAQIGRVDRRGHQRVAGRCAKSGFAVIVRPEREDAAVLGQQQAVLPARGHLRDLESAQIRRVDRRRDERFADRCAQSRLPARIRAEGKHGAVLGEQQVVIPARGHLRDFAAAKIRRVDRRGDRSCHRRTKIRCHRRPATG